MAAGIVGFASIVHAQIVNCDSLVPPNRIQAQLNQGFTFIQFTGSCPEFVTVFQDGTTILGVGPTPAANVIQLGFTASGVQRVFLSNLTINAPESGVFFADGAFVRMVNSVIENTRDGLELIRNAGAVVQNSTLGLTTGTDPAFSCGPVCLLENSSLRLVNSTVVGNVNDPGIGPALSIARDSSVTLRGVSRIANAGSQAAVGVSFGSSFRQDNLFAPPGGPTRSTIEGGVEVSGNAFADLRDVQIIGDAARPALKIDLQSTVRLGSSIFGNPAQLVVTGDAILSRGSALAVESNLVTVNGNVICQDNQTSRISGTFQASGKVACRRFE